MIYEVAEYADKLGHFIQGKKCEYVAHAFIRLVTYYSFKLSPLHTNWKLPITAGHQEKKNSTLLYTFATKSLIRPK